MRRTVAVLIIWSFGYLLHGQTRITYAADSLALSMVLAELEQKYQLYFSYGVDQITSTLITIDVHETAIDSFLITLLHPHYLEFEQVENRFYSISSMETSRIRVSLKDAENREGLSFATARLTGTTQGFVANQQGLFEMTINNPRESSLEFSFVGYKPLQMQIRDLDPTQPIELRLQKEIRELDGVVVREYLNQGITIDDRAAAVNIDVQDMEILPGLAERDVLLSAQILAGVGSADESASGINIRGSASNNSSIYWNNIPIYQAAHYFGNISSFIPSVVGEVEVLKNYIPTKYGNSTSGMFLISSRKGAEKWVGESNLNLTHADIYTSFPFADGDGHVTLGGRRSYNDLLATPTFISFSNKLFEGTVTQDLQQGLSDDEFRYNSKLIFGDLNLVMDYEWSSRNELSLSLLYSASRLNYHSNLDEDDENEIASQIHNVDSKGANVSWTSRWHDQWSSELSSSYADYHMDYGLLNRRTEDDETSSDREIRGNNLRNWENRLTITYSPVRNQYLNGGYQFNKISADLSIDESYYLEEDFVERTASEGSSHGIFLDYFGKYENGLQLGAGWRQNWYATVEESKMEGQLRLNYEINSHALIKSSWGVYNQYVTTNQELDFIFSNTIEQNWVIADDVFDVPVLRNIQGVVGFVYNKQEWLVDVDLYHKDVDAPVSRNFGLAVDYDGSQNLFGSERVWGIDLTLKRRWKNYRAWVSYTYQNSEVSVELSEDEQIHFPSGINLPHHLQLSQTLRHGPWEFSTGYTLRSGLSYTQGVDLEFINDDEDEDPYYDIRYQEIHGNRLKAYHRFDLSTWYKFQRNTKPKFRGEFGLSILNLFNTRNLYSRTFFVDESEEGDQAVLSRRDRHLIGLTPNFSVRFSW